MKILGIFNDAPDNVQGRFKCHHCSTVFLVEKSDKVTLVPMPGTEGLVRKLSILCPSCGGIVLMSDRD